MSKVANDQAFPSPAPNQHSGMTLRDWFAGMALSSGRVLPTTMREPTAADVAKDCYDVADAMLKARE